jgi:hypothetical protein
LTRWARWSRCCGRDEADIRAPHGGERGKARAWLGQERPNEERGE